MEIEKASGKDLPEILSQVRKEFPYLEMDEEKLKERLLHPNIFIYKIKKGEKLAAFVDFEILVNFVGRITAVAVLQEFRNSGFGKKLVSLAIEKLKEAGCKKILLIVAKENRRAISLYKSFGFRKIEGGEYEISGKEVFDMAICFPG